MSDLKLKTCCADNCGKHAKRGDKYCSMHRARLSRHGELNKKSAYDRLLSAVTKIPNGCWEYSGYLNRFGYGRLRHNGKKILAHRLSYIFNVGEIACDALVLHKCDNPKCVNPDHLYLGSAKDNANDMVKRNRQWLQRAKSQKLTFCLSKGVYPDGYEKI